ncbi:hypothetical protein GURASL_29090 [Geotalea uraniireducens]|uniref:Uncharacterized protein n=1 Tax=Geotalea uraniireducens TaxID=351604 RepID=A0ABM8ENZ9_9BACT|nr:hypothetical protein GURASL_29090 [Geotalea uraniireducens]
MLTVGYPEDELMLEFIWKSIVGYFIGKEVEQLDIAKLPFDKYTTYLQSELPYENIVSTLQIEKKGATGGSGLHSTLYVECRPDP